VERTFARSGPNQLWVTDITEHPTREGKIYCCAVLDTYSRRVVGWSIDASPTAALVTNALGMAIDSRRPEPGTLIHSDHGVQFASWAFTDRAKWCAPASVEFDCWILGVLTSGGSVGARGYPAEFRRKVLDLLEAGRELGEKGWRLMTATLNDVAKKKDAEQSAAIELVRMAREQGLSLIGPDGLLKQLTKTVLEAALHEEMTEHLGYEKHDPAGAGSGNVRNGARSKSVLTENTGQVEIDVPRDRAGTFEPQIVRKRQRRLNGVDEIVLSTMPRAWPRRDLGSLRRDLRRLGVEGDD